MNSSSFVTAEDEYTKNEDLRPQDVAMMKEWLRKQPHLPNLTDLQIIHFLHSCYYRNEAAKSCIETFYTVRALCPEFFANRNPVTNSSEIFDIVLYTPLPKLTPEGYKIIFAKFIDLDPDRYSLPSQIKVFDMTSMLMLQQEGTYKGHVLITDIDGITFGHVKKFGLLHLKKFFMYLQEAMPLRLVQLHTINIPSFMDKIMALIRPFMKKELLDSLQLHVNVETLFKSIPQECLPKDYGGTADSIAELLVQRRNNLLAHTQYFIEEEAQIADESKRTGKPKDAGDVFGVEGTFKKLDID